MPGYTKLFSDIIDSSIWREPPPICKVWITLLALCDPDGFVRGSIGWLAEKARVDAAQVQEAITKFSSPDPVSRTPDNDGRRIELLTDGWLILNYLSFRDRLSNDPKACASRERVRKHRERYMALRNALGVTPRPESEASSESETDSKSEDKKSEPQAKSPAEMEFAELWKAYPSKTGSIPKSLAAWIKWRKAGDTLVTALDGISRYRASVEAQRRSGFADLKYQNGQTFFNGRGWATEWIIETKQRVGRL